MASDDSPRLALADAVLVAIPEDNKGTVCRSILFQMEAPLTRVQQCILFASKSLLARPAHQLACLRPFTPRVHENVRRTFRSCRTASL